MPVVARPRTLGPSVSFRLPIDLHVVAEKLARLRGMTVNEYLAERLIEALSRQRDTPIIATVSTPSETRQVTPVWKASMKP